jgi:hypothetical protein
MPEIKIEDLEKTTKAMEQLHGEVEALKKNQITEDAFMAKGKQLVEVALKEHDEKRRQEEQRKAIFPTGKIGGDPRTMALKKAAGAVDPEDRLSRIAHAFTLPTDNKALEEFPRVHDELVIVNAAMAARHRGTYRGIESLETYRRFKEVRDLATKYMDDTDTANWVPTGEAAMLLETPYLTGNVESLFEHIYCPTATYNYPVLLNGPDVIGVYVAENTAHVDPSTDPGAQALADGKFSWAAKKVRGRMVTSGELNEDSVVAIVPNIKAELPKITARSVETCILNGDMTATHMDADVEALGATDPRTMWYGLRYHGMHASLKVALTTWAIGTMRGMRGKLKAYGVNPLDLAWIFSIHDYLKYIVVNDDVRTQNVYGPRATVFTGQLEQLDGSPIIVSPHVPTNLAATGFNTGGGDTASAVILVNKNYWKVGDRRLFTIEANRLLNVDQIEFVSFRRLDFQPFATPDGTYTCVSCGYGTVA